MTAKLVAVAVAAKPPVADPVILSVPTVEPSVIRVAVPVFDPAAIVIDVPPEAPVPPKEWVTAIVSALVRVPLAGVSVAVMTTDPPAAMVAGETESVTPVATTVAATVMTEVAVKASVVSVTVTVAVAVPVAGGV